MTRRAALVLAAVILIWTAFFWYQIRYNPHVEFLYPVRGATWILYPEEFTPGIKDSEFLERAGRVTFRRIFSLDRPPARCTVRVTAMTAFRIAVNGIPGGSSPGGREANWKTPTTVEIGRGLRTGRNVLSVTVTNPSGLPALLLRGCVDGPMTLGSGHGWEATRAGTNDWRPARRPAPPDRYLRSYPRQFLLPASLLLALYLAFLLFAVIPRARHAGRPAPGPRSQPLLHLTSPVLWAPLLLSLLAFLNFSNASRYPVTRGFDARAHLDYVVFVATHWYPPLATQGSEMFQPPLYYYLAALLYRTFRLVLDEPAALKTAQHLSALAGTASVIVTFMTLRVLCPRDRFAQLAGTCTAAFLPVQLWMNPRVTNDVMVGLLTSLTFYAMARRAFVRDLTPAQAGGLGVLTGLALLTKFTALPLFFTLALVLGLRLLDPEGHRGRELRCLLAFLASAALVSGWFYARNVLVFGNPVVGNWDELSGFRYEQMPGFRWLGFYTKFGSVFFAYPFHNRWISFWDGFYASFWADGHAKFATRDYQAALMRVILWLAAMPTAAIVVGFLRALRSAATRPVRNADLAPVVFTFLTLTAALYLTMRLPFYSTINARVLLGLIVPVSAFAASGLRTMCDNLGRWRWILYAHLLVMEALVAFVFWYRQGDLL